MADGEPSAASEAATPNPTPDGGRGSTVPAVTACERGGARKPKVGLRGRLGLAVAGGAALVGVLVSVVVAAAFAPPVPRATAASLAGALSGARQFVDDDAGPESTADVPPDAAPAHAPTWRVAQLGAEDGVTLINGVIERRPLLVALGGAGLSHAEAERVTRSLAEAREVNHFGAKDAFTLARDKASGRVVAFEVASSPLEVWQGREQPGGSGAPALVTKKLDLVPESQRVHKAVLVGADLRASLDEAGLAPVDEILSLLDDALEGHAEMSNLRSGARLRIVGTRQVIDGALTRWLSLDAVEYFPASDQAPSVRVYQFGDDEASKKHRGWYDAKGKQPVHGGWRMPVPLARIASRFNPHRMHPVLHVVMPHNGVDLAAPSGTPVYATAAGTVTSAGDGGPCGNRIEIAHPHGITSVYCHLSRFAPGIHAGLRVEQRQLIAYVGQTGRVTGPHLHFGIRRGDTFIDPMTLRLDGVRVVPRARRDEFDRVRAQLDSELDSIRLPVPVGVPSTEVEPETIYEEPP